MPAAGTLTIGGSSTTVIVNAARPVALVAVSTASQCTSVRPMWNVEPDAGVHSTCTDENPFGLTPTLYATGVPAAVRASTVIGPGTIGIGAVPSLGRPTPMTSDGQLSLQPPPIGESTTWVSDRSENPSGNVAR